MKRMIFISLAFSLFFDVYASILAKRDKTPVRYSQIQKITKSLNKEDFKKNLREFVRCCYPNRMVGTPGHKHAVPWLISRIKKLDLGKNNIVWVDEFKPDIKYAIDMYKNDFKKEVESSYRPTNPIYKKWKKFTDNMIAEIQKRKAVVGKNIIWEKKGILNPNEVIIIGAHYDTVANKNNHQEIDAKMEAPGADDNGSGVSVALGLIRLLSQLNLPKTVQVVFFDYEELGFLGSRAFVQKYKEQLKKKKFAGYVNLEMLGHDSKKFDKTKRFGNMKIYIRKKGSTGYVKDLRLAQRLQAAGKKVNNSVRFEISANSFQNSDNINFWDENFPSLTFSEDWENDFNASRYHSSNDFVETLNMKTLYNSFRYISGSIIAWGFDILK